MLRESMIQLLSLTIVKPQNRKRMKRFIIILGLFLSLFAAPSYALNWQAVITSDGKLHKLPADIPQELVNAYIDSYEDILEMSRVLEVFFSFLIYLHTSLCMH